MKSTPSVIVGLVFIALLLVFGLRMRVKGGGLPPHEFAYGTPLRDCEAIPQAMESFLSLGVMDPHAIQIETFVDNENEKNLAPLIRYISSKKDSHLEPLIAALKNIDGLSNQKDKAIQLVRTLCPYKDSLRDESQHDKIIVFVYYALMQPAGLPGDARTKISKLVRQLDTTTEAADFDSGKCPENYLVGNMNVYPLALENRFWHRVADFPSPEDAPILEIRFMGLKGIFRYMLDEMTARTGDSFLHLDGESL